MILKIMFFIITFIPNNFKILLLNKFPNIIIDKKVKLGLEFFCGKKINIIQSKIEILII